MLDTLIASTNPTVAHLNIDMSKPPSMEVVQAIKSACNQAEDAKDSAVLLVHISGSDKADNTPLPTPGNINMVNQWEKALRRLERVNAITVSVVKGQCNGIGMTLMLATDYRIIERDTKLGLVLENGGVMPGMTLYRLVNQIGMPWAKRMALLGEQLTSEKANALGLVDIVSDDCDSATAMFLESLVQIDTTDLSIRRRLLLDASSMSYEEAVGSHLAACDRYLRNLTEEVVCE